MAKLLKLRRGTTSQHSSFTGAEGEVTVDTDKETLVVHDGSTAGGHAVAAEDMANVSSANIVGRLGTGSIVKAKLEADAIDGTKLADDAVDSEHIAAGAVDLEHMSSESVDEDNLKISNAGTNGQFLSKQSGDAGGLTWATASTDLSGDTTPQLGGNLDVNTKNITFGDSSDGASDDALTFGVGAGGVPDLSIYSDGTNGVLKTQDGGTILIKDGSNTMATFSGASNQIDFGVHCTWQGASSNAAWDKANSRFSGTITEFNVTANNSTDETVYPLFADGATGSQGAETDTGFTYNPSSGNLTIGGELDAASGDFSGDVDIDGTLEADAITVNGTALNTVIAGVTVTNATNATNLTVTSETTDTDCYPVFVTASSGTLPAKVRSGGLYFNSASSNLTASGGFSNGAGNIQAAVPISESNNVTLTASYANRTVYTSASGASVTVPTGVFSPGDMVTIINNSSSDQTITCSAITMYLANDTTAKTSLTLAGRGMCTMFWATNAIAYISGAGLS